MLKTILPTKLFKIVIITLFLSCLAVFLWWKQSNLNSKFKLNLDQAAVIKEIQELNKLETASFNIEKIIDAGTDANQFKEFLFGDRILLIAHGRVVAGIDLSKIEGKDIQINEESKELKIKLAAPQIFHTIIDNEKTKVYDRKKGILTKGQKDLEAQARQAAEESIQEAACEADILDIAATSAEKQLIILFKALGFESVIIKIEKGNC
ncbi:MAG: DUF4230 domain-containing protein [Candidatus Woesebacteria bacterium]|jgi:hypothetical protein